jgi:tetratricopeptide (TPR) repeat protein
MFGRIEVSMIRACLLLVPAVAALAAEPARYELDGRIVPRLAAYVSLFGVAAPYSASTPADVAGHFKFKNLEPGSYTLSVFSRRRGVARKTIDVGPSGADRKRRVALTLRLQDLDFETASLMRSNLVSLRQLAVPEGAFHDYRQAQKDLARHDPDAAIKRLEHAVDLAPQFATAWNELGVIAYQTKKYDRAEECFRQAVAQDPQSFEALVNLGGVLLSESKLDESMDYNRKAVLASPNDALANAQLGMTYFALAQDDLAVKYLQRARDLDPGHFSRPQLVLFQIHLRHGENQAAAGDLEDFLKHHPDSSDASQFRDTIAKLRASAP